VAYPVHVHIEYREAAARGDGYPVGVWVDEPERRSRLTPLLRPVLAIPA
jgi:hypothetical protein